MGVAFYPTFEDGNPDGLAEIAGKPLARAADVLAKVAKRWNVPDLYHFYSMDRHQMIVELLDGDPDDPASYDESKLLPEHWHEPTAGLATVRALLEYVRHDGSSIDDLVREDLETFERLLQSAIDRGTRWHLTIYS
ncbi:MAG: hypothetical protein KF708_14965 [Pirellulales bacterium]|nr:hypothetical protein [Pirellulales bacterium]